MSANSHKRTFRGGEFPLCFEPHLIDRGIKSDGPIICWLFPRSRYTSGKYLAWVIGLYVAAKVLENFDAGVFDLLGNVISGHSLKHLLSAVATYMILRMLVQSKTRNP